MRTRYQLSWVFAALFHSITVYMGNLLTFEISVEAERNLLHLNSFEDFQITDNRTKRDFQ